MEDVITIDSFDHSFNPQGLDSSCPIELKPSTAIPLWTLKKNVLFRWENQWFFKFRITENLQSYDCYQVSPRDFEFIKLKLMMGYRLERLSYPVCVLPNFTLVTPDYGREL